MAEHILTLVRLCSAVHKIEESFSCTKTISSLETLGYLLGHRFDLIRICLDFSDRMQEMNFQVIMISAKWMELIA